MAEEKEVNEGPAQEDAQQKPRKGSKGLIIVIVMIVAALAGGYVLYTQFISGHASASKKEEPKKAAKENKSTLLALDPFIMNLAEQGRFLKVTMQLEIGDAALVPAVTERMPQLRDAIITLVSSKSADALASPEGKFQLKDDILLRANQAMGGGTTFKNLYFTEFVMQ